jgi:hypothetical protein
MLEFVPQLAGQISFFVERPYATNAVIEPILIFALHKSNSGVQPLHKLFIAPRGLRPS